MVDYSLLDKANLARYSALRTGNAYQGALADIYLARFEISCYLDRCPECGSQIIAGACTTAGCQQNPGERGAN
jgi:hypothetical protein